MIESRPVLPLNPMRVFAVASRHPTFTSAARELGVTQVAVSRQIAILEGFLGVSLFERNSRSARLTDVGRAYGRELGVLFDDLEAATHRLLRMEGENTIHLRLYPSLAHFWLLPRMRDFISRNLGVRVRLDTKVEPLDFRGTHLNLAIQLGNGVWRNSRSRELFAERIDAVCSPEFQAGFGGKIGLADLPKIQLLHSRYRRRAWEQWAEAHSVDLAGTGGLEYDSSLLTYSAAVQGLGLAMGQMDLIQDEIDAGRLMAPFAKPVVTGQSFHVVWPTSQSVNVKTRRFIDWLLEQANEEPEFFSRKS